MLIDLIKENGFTPRKAKSEQYPAETITDSDYVSDIVPLANTPTQTEFLLHSPEQAAGSIGLHGNVGKMEFMYFNQKGVISTLNDTSLKLGEKFTYLGSSVSFTERDINMCLAKAWTAFDHMEVWPMHDRDKWWERDR